MNLIDWVVQSLRMRPPSKHAPGRSSPRNAGNLRRRRRKRQRQARRYARLCATGAKHQWKAKR